MKKYRLQDTRAIKVIKNNAIDIGHKNTQGSRENVIQL